MRRRFAQRVGMIAAAMVMLSSPSAEADLYRYRAADGTLHFSDEPMVRAQRPINASWARADHDRRPRAVLSPQPGRFSQEVSRASVVTGLDKRLLHAVIAVESDYRPEVVSQKGAMGLMQLMPATAAELGVGDPFDPEENILGGARYLRRLWDRFGDLTLALAAYNAGPERVEQFGGVPPFAETEGYVARVRRLYPQGAWHRAGGATGVATRIYEIRLADGGVLYTDTPR
jgi:soluble lytic murein transglycosylase-like protein